MANELMPCPVCGGTVHNDSITLACGNRYPSGDSDGEIGCPYFLDVNCDKLKTPDAREYWLAHTHNTLARRAEIGALVEWIVEAAPGLLTIGRTAMTDGVTIYSAWSSKPFTDERSLLDALRALAKEVGCE